MKDTLVLIALLASAAAPAGFAMVASFSAHAQPPALVDHQTGKYLGNYSSNKYDPNSISNPYGKHGSKYMPDSINNQYGRYGSKYSPDSVNNPYGYNAPIIVMPCYGC